MVYHQIRILLHRPFVSEASETGLRAGEECTSSAEAISRLIQVFGRHYTFQYIHIQAVATVMTAAVVHAHDSCTYSGQRGRRAKDNLVTCTQALAGMGQLFHSSIRGLEVINSLRRMWQTQKFRDCGPKRHRETMSSAEGSSLERSKRVA